VSALALPRPRALFAAHPQVRRIAAEWLVPVALAAAVAVWGMRGVSTNEFAHPDAPRHALNGVLIHDWITQGHLENPVRFAKRFYSRLPGTSIPYHPPLFPAVESLFYMAGGVNRLSARLAIAFSAFLAALLLFWLVRATHGGAGFAALSVAITFLIPEVQRDAADVMLEMPSLVFVLAALWSLRGGKSFGMAQAVPFGLLAAAAIWTKQQAVFLIGVPFLMSALARQWRAILRRPVWLASGIILASAAALVSLTALAGAGDNRQWDPINFVIPFQHLAFYAGGLARENGIVAAVLAGSALLFPLVRPTARNHLYLAWAVSSLALLLVMPPVVERYLFFTYPALAVLACDAGRRLLPSALPGYARTIAGCAAILLAAFFWLRPPEFVRGPGRAAALVMQNHPARILYCGFNDGDFLFAVRELDPGAKTIVIRGDKLPRETFTPQAMERFARDYGVEYIVIERIHYPRKWTRLAEDPAPSMQWLASVRVASSMHFENGETKVFRFLRPSPTPKTTLQVRSDLVKSGLQVDF